MKSITIHGLNAYLDEKIKEKAKTEGISINKAVKKILSEALGEDASNDRMEDFRELFGVWSKQAEFEFTEATKLFEQINDEDWQ